jgi:C-terminal processing protease CtpA/Prc
LEALARLIGYVRYFHPTDAATSADWNALTIASVRAVEDAQSPTDLAARLQTQFAPVAPLVRVVPTGAQSPRIELPPGRQLIVWEHHGVGVKSESFYRSRRIAVPTSADLLNPFPADLPGGVTCSVPIGLPGDVTTATPKDMTGEGSAFDRSTRLAAVIIAWNVFQHFYPYFDVTHTDWQLALRSALTRSAEDRDPPAFIITLRKMIATLHDGHGYVSGPGAPPMFIPPVIWTWAENRVVALTVQGIDSVHPGDAVISVNGKQIANVLAEKESTMSCATSQCFHFGLTRSLLEGPLDESVRVELESLGKPGSTREVILHRSERVGQLQEPRPDKIKEVRPGVWYLDVNSISDSDYGTALPMLTNASGLVFDMRGYPSHVKDVANFLGHMDILPLHSAPFLVPIVTRPDRSAMTFQDTGWSVPALGPYLPAKKAFLTDGRAISYSETIMGIVEHYKIGEIVGEATAGTNGSVNPFLIPGGYLISWTGMKVIKHDGSQHHGIGILPTIPVSLTRAGIAAGRDEILERGIQAVSSH